MTNTPAYGYLVTVCGRRPATLNEAIKGYEGRRLPAVNGYQTVWCADSEQYATVIDAMQAQAEDAREAAREA